MPRRCPCCGRDTIIGHGRRRRQSHDADHDWIWVRRGRCRPCRQTFTLLPTWAVPHGHYSLRCRRQAWQSACRDGGGWEHCAPPVRDPQRLPDPATLRRWACRRLLALVYGLNIFRLWRGEGTFLQAPTILAWDWAAAWRNLRWEAHSP